MSYDYEKYDGKRIVVDGEIIGLLAMEFGHEVEEVWEEYHAELTMTEEQERQSEAYKESLRRALSAQYEKVATLESENAKLRELLKYNGAVIEACTSEILDHVGVPYIVGPAGVTQALMEATAMLVHKRYDFDPPSFYKEDK